MRSGRPPTAGLSRVRLAAFLRLQREVMCRLDGRRKIPKTITHAGYRFRIIPFAGGRLIVVATYSGHLPIFGVRPMPATCRPKVTP